MYNLIMKIIIELTEFYLLRFYLVRVKILNKYFTKSARCNVYALIFKKKSDNNLQRQVLNMSSTQIYIKIPNYSRKYKSELHWVLVTGSDNISTNNFHSEKKLQPRISPEGTTNSKIS